MAVVKSQGPVKSEKKMGKEKVFRLDDLCAEAYEKYGLIGAVYFRPGNRREVLKVGKLSVGD